MRIDGGPGVEETFGAVELGFFDRDLVFSVLAGVLIDTAVLFTDAEDV
jgi:hypothetical protein